MHVHGFGVLGFWGAQNRKRFGLRAEGHPQEAQKSSADHWNNLARSALTRQPSLGSSHVFGSEHLPRQLLQPIVAAAHKYIREAGLRSGWLAG